MICSLSIHWLCFFLLLFILIGWNSIECRRLSLVFFFCIHLSIDINRLNSTIFQSINWNIVIDSLSSVCFIWFFFEHYRTLKDCLWRDHLKTKMFGFFVETTTKTNNINNNNNRPRPCQKKNKKNEIVKVESWRYKCLDAMLIKIIVLDVRLFQITFVSILFPIHSFLFTDRIRSERNNNAIKWIQFSCDSFRLFSLDGIIFISVPTIVFDYRWDSIGSKWSVKIPIEQSQTEKRIDWNGDLKIDYYLTIKFVLA